MKYTTKLPHDRSGIDEEAFELIHEGVPQEVFLIMSFTRRIPKGKVVFNDSFQANC
ncbi:MAG: hypothetical protein GY710_17445 [Desulfobacteraceae bacterium]|nr:hypothetical protein [Desulfobacteraceae bacterium]